MGNKNFVLFDSLPLNKNSNFASVRVSAVDVSSEQLDEYIGEIALDWTNLCYGLSIDATSDRNMKITALKRFLPTTLGNKNVEEFVNEQNNPSFYSFLAEYLLSVVMRDVFHYNLCAAAILIGETITDNHTGVDACFYDSATSKIILGESKFYHLISGGIARIKSDFISGKSISKLASLYSKATANPKSLKIILQKIGINDYSELTFEDFLKLDLVFAGFVMHEDRKNITALELKNLCNFVASDINEHVKMLGYEIKNNYSLFVLNLPVKSKNELIIKIIKKALFLKGEL